MKRRITELEQKLLDNGWKLYSKNYCGKYSQFTMNYQFYKVIGFGSFACEVCAFLDKKREKVVDYKVLVDHEYIDKETFNNIGKIFELLERDLFGE